MKSVIDNRINNVKFICLFSIICAHTISANIEAYRFLQIIGICGVPCFFFLSGFLFTNHQKQSIGAFFRKRMITMIIPWLFVGSITYFINSLFGSKVEHLTIVNYILYIIGYHSHLYYLTVLSFFYVIFWRMDNSIIKLIIYIGLPISALYVITVDYFINLNESIIYPYLNPMFWIGFFSLGLMLGGIQKNQSSKNLMIFLKNKTTILFLSFLWTVSGLAIWFRGHSFVSYFSVLAFLFELIVVLISACYLIQGSNKRINWVSEVGNNSMFIYLTHIVIIGFLNTILKTSISFDFAKPVIVILIYLITTEIILRIMRSNNLLNKIGQLFGLKKERYL